MEPLHDYFSLSESKSHQRGSWHQWPASAPAWESATPNEMPIWQYTAAALNQGGPPSQYYPTESPISPTYPSPSSVTSAHNTPIRSHFAKEVRFPPLPLTPLYDPPANCQTMQTSLNGYSHEEEEKDDEMDDEDSDSYSWDLKPSSSKASTSKPAHRRSQSANEVTLRNAKRAHTVVEKNYRERLNDKINDLATYLFETSSDSRTKPSKSLVMTRAKERLKQLESRNKSLESEVVKLRQHIAILDHIVASSSEGKTTPRMNDSDGS